IISITTNSFNNLRNRVRDKMTEVRDNVRDGWNKAVDILRNVNLRQIGANIIQGLINGIKSKIQAISNAVKDVTDRITGRLKSILKIQSPSRVFMQLGGFVGEGFALGIEKTSKLVDKASDAMAQAAIPEAKQINLTY